MRVYYVILVYLWSVQQNKLKALAAAFYKVLAFFQNKYIMLYSIRRNLANITVDLLEFTLN